MIQSLCESCSDNMFLYTEKDHIRLGECIDESVKGKNLAGPPMTHRHRPIERRRGPIGRLFDTAARTRDCREGDGKQK